MGGRKNQPEIGIAKVLWAWATTCSFLLVGSPPLGGRWYAYNTHYPAKKAVFGLMVQVFWMAFLFKEQVKK